MYSCPISAELMPQPLCDHVACDGDVEACMQLRAYNGRVDARAWPDTALPYGNIAVNGSALGGLVYGHDLQPGACLDQFDAVFGRNVRSVFTGEQALLCEVHMRHLGMNVHRALCMK